MCKNYSSTSQPNSYSIIHGGYVCVWGGAQERREHNTCHHPWSPLDTVMILQCGAGPGTQGLLHFKVCAKRLFSSSFRRFFLTFLHIPGDGITSMLYFHCLCLLQLSSQPLHSSLQTDLRERVNGPFLLPSFSPPLSAPADPCFSLASSSLMFSPHHLHVPCS